jgi:peptide/nickel transport system substrate-binding protein
MARGHEVSADGLTWTIALREGLRFHDNEPVRGRDCVASIRRWAVRDGFGQVLMRAVAELDAPTDATIRFRLRRPFPALLDALAKPGASPCFMMPERTALTPPDRPITDMTGSGPWRWIAGDYVQGARAAYARNEAYQPRDEPAEAASGGKRVHFDRLELVWIPDGGTAAAALRTGEVDWVEYPLPDLVPVLERDRNVRTQVYDPNGFLGFLRFNHLHPPFSDVRVRRAIRDVLVPARLHAGRGPARATGGNATRCSPAACPAPRSSRPRRAARPASSAPATPCARRLCRRADHPHQPDDFPPSPSRAASRWT